MYGYSSMQEWLFMYVYNSMQEWLFVYGYSEWLLMYGYSSMQEWLLMYVYSIACSIVANLLMYISRTFFTCVAHAQNLLRNTPYKTHLRMDFSKSQD